MYTLRVYIDASIVESKPEDSLVLLRKVNGVYSVPFGITSIEPESDQQALLQINKFQWKDDFAVSLVLKDNSPQQVNAQELSGSSDVPIILGQKVTCSKNVLSEAVQADPSLFSDPADQKNAVLIFSVPDFLRSCLSMRTPKIYKQIYVDRIHHTGVSNHQIKPDNEYTICWADSQDRSFTPEIHGPRSKMIDFGPGVSEINLRWGYKILNTPENVEEEHSWCTWIPSLP